MLEHLAVRDNPFLLHVQADAVILLLRRRYAEVPHHSLRMLRHLDIVIKSDNMANLCGFGWFVRTLQHTAVISQCHRTPLYMPPELARGAKLARPASDMFSLGVVAYELLTGDLPSQVPPIALNVKSGQRWYTALSIRCPDLSGPIGDAIERCLDPAPERRPTAQALFDLQLVILEP